MDKTGKNQFYKAFAAIAFIFCIACFVVPFVVANMPAKPVQSPDEVSNDEIRGDQIIKLKMTTRIKETITTDAGSMFTDLKPEAVKIGLPEAQLYGSVRQEKLADESTRMYIRWHSIGIPASQGEQLTGNLDSPLRSQLRTKADSVDPGQIINARGDLDALIEKFIELKKRAKRESPRHLVEQDDEEKESGLSPGGDSGSRTRAGGDYGNSPDSPSDFSTSMLTMQWEDCSPRVAQEEGKVYRQAKQVEYDESGKVVNSGRCEDHGGYVEIQKSYGEPCSVIFNYENRKAYEQYREYAEVDGEYIAVTNCSNDFSRSYEIYARTDDCGIRHDFEGGRSIVQEKLFYQNNAGEEFNITGCQDSNKAYAHFLTEATCSPFTDKVNNTVTLYKRTAWKLDDGTIDYASECRAVDGGTRELFEAFCDQKYEHDFNVGQSFYRTRDYYLDDNNQPVYLTGCTRSTTASFPHLYETSGCGTVHDDEKLQSVQKTSTWIDTPDDGKVELSPCQDNGTVVPYTYTGFENREKVFTSSATWTVPTGVTSVNVFAVAGGNSGGNGSETGNGGNGGGRNGGKGDVRPGNAPHNAHGAGGGGGAGEQVTKTVNVTAGQTITITIGQSDQDTSFGSLAVARHDYGQTNGIAVATDGNGVYGGDGGSGYGEAQLSQHGACGRWGSVGFNNGPFKCNPDDTGFVLGRGGSGYGAGGGGGMGGYSHENYGPTAGGKGAPGYMKITWVAAKYRRVDGSVYVQE